ncbi:hypothetical protein P148_SR1C00001G0063 [candidate division SR1 bacterium RAAC1_SR1_1]|nr:hypothetical protein P148_SR1C00001G0063 [candidate division SR1 bacterium RAAC1_SR1_1]
MKFFGIEKRNVSTRKPLQAVSVVFFILLAAAFSLILFYHKISLFLFEKDKIDVFKEDLQQIAIYFLPIDKQVAHFLVTLDHIIQGYLAGENILITQEKEIEETREYMQKNKSYLKKMGFAGYEKIIDFVADLRKYKSEFFDLMGKNKPYNYLVILQNTNEKRPNGGFFGSFAFITMDKGHIKNLEIVDSYYPDFIAYRTRIMAPEWTSAFLPDRKIGFIAGNKFGFTDIDGKNLKDLYEKMFNETYEMRKVKQTMAPDLYEKLLNKYIKGVIFIRSDTIEEIIPGFREKIWEWQFLNASVDLLRGEIRGNKKEMYIQEVKSFFAKHRTDIIKNVVNNFEELTKKQAINIWLSNVSTGMQETIQKNNLINTFKTGFMYAWDTNTSFDKVDGFVTKYIQIKDANNDTVKEMRGDIIDINDLSKGKYTMGISYELKVPDQYIAFIKGLEKKYDIEITDREKGILAIQSSVFDDPKRGKVTKWRETKSTLYVPKNIVITDVEGETLYDEKFTTPFANGLFYQILINTNNTKKSVKINFEMK